MTAQPSEATVSEAQQLGQRFQQVRKDANLSQADFAARLGFSQQTISTVEIGLVAPSVELLANLAKEFKVDLNQVIAGEPFRDAELANLEEVRKGYRELLGKIRGQVKRLQAGEKVIESVERNLKDIFNTYRNQGKPADADHADNEIDQGRHYR
ncbi:MAG: helix-turn-helix transcriptional regulator [Sedimentisphaerales bacterium]|nr:helix-turn-helix transcriptional regulator [Sedimentisphaerales bacterium]